VKKILNVNNYTDNLGIYATLFSSGYIGFLSPTRKSPMARITADWAGNFCDGGEALFAKAPVRVTFLTFFFLKK
jgi:hypothetical protein